MLIILKSKVKKLVLSLALTSACLGQELEYKPFELSVDKVKESNVGNLDSIVPDCRKIIYEYLNQTDLVSFAQTSLAFYSEIRFYLKSPSTFALQKILPNIIGRGLRGQYKNFNSILKLKNAYAGHLPFILPFCQDVLYLDLSESTINDFVDISKSKTALEYIGNRKSLANLEKLHISNVTLDGKWGILPILKSPHLKKLHTLSWTNSDIHDSFKETTLSLKVLDLSGSKIRKDAYTTLSETPSFQDLEELNLAGTLYLEKNKPINPDLSNLLICTGESFLVLPQLKNLIIPSSVTIPAKLSDVRPNLKITQIPYNK